MNEQQRREYLQRMGYEVYYPRFFLSGARPSPSYEIPETPETEKHQPRDTLTKSSTARPIVEDIIQSRPEAVQPVSAATSGQVTKRQIGEKQSDDLRFSLQFFVINKHLAVLSELPHQLRGKQSKDNMALLQAIIKAIVADYVVEEGLRPVEFDWPIAEGLAAPDPRRAATLALQGFINQRQEQDRFENLLLFSGQIHELLLAQREGVNYGDQESGQIRCQLTVTHSLQSMLVHPLLKRDTWAHVQALKKRLQA